MNRKSIELTELNLNIFSKVLSRGALLCAGTMDDANCMTIAWAQMGVLWHKKVFSVYVRPTRHTFSYMENNNDFTVNFFTGEYKEALSICGTQSGRNIDKFQQSNLDKIKREKTTSPGIDQACLIIGCKTIGAYNIDPNQFIDASLDRNYPNKDYHRVYIGEILEIEGTEYFKS